MSETGYKQITHIVLLWHTVLRVLTTYTFAARSTVKLLWHTVLRVLTTEVKRYILAGHLGRADLFGLTRTADSVPAPKSPDRGKRVVRKP